MFLDFKKENKDLGCFANTPKLQQFLESYGMKKISRFYTVVCEACDLKISDFKTDLEIRKAQENEKDLFPEVFTQGYGLPLEIGRLFVEDCYLKKDGVPVQYYFPWSKQYSKPVGFACSLDYPVGSDYSLWAGVGVLKEFREKGVYKAFIQRRMDDLRVRNKSTILSLANESTSHPILKNLGFKTIGTHELYGFF